MVPHFRNSPLTGGAFPNILFGITGLDHALAETAILQYPSMMEIAVKFTVSKEPLPADILTLYLQANGEQPVFAKIKGGVTENPLELSWYVGPEFKMDKSKILYRYKPGFTGWIGP